jgi:hypothetical protein
MFTLVKKLNYKNHVFFMLHAFNQSEHYFDQCEHFNQIENFQKPRFLIHPNSFWVSLDFD